MLIDISKIWPGWTIAPDEIGSGGYGHVYKAVNESTDAVSAVKIVPVAPTEDELTKLKLCGKSDALIRKLCLTKAEKMLAEIKVMQKLKGCANIVSIEDSALVERPEGFGYDIYIRMEYLIPLQNYLDSHPRLTDADIVKLGCDICSALEICHKKLLQKSRSFTVI